MQMWALPAFYEVSVNSHSNKKMPSFTSPYLTCALKYTVVEKTFVMSQRASITPSQVAALFLTTGSMEYFIGRL